MEGICPPGNPVVIAAKIPAANPMASVWLAFGDSAMARNMLANRKSGLTPPRSGGVMVCSKRPSANSSDDVVSVLIFKFFLL